MTIKKLQRTFLCNLKVFRLGGIVFLSDESCFISLQESDLRYLVENVWNSQSAISAWDDLYDLVLVRWERHSEWSPWNCCLLTKEEASAHEKLQDLTEVKFIPLCRFEIFSTFFLICLSQISVWDIIPPSKCYTPFWILRPLKYQAKFCYKQLLIQSNV